MAVDAVLAVAELPDGRTAWASWRRGRGADTTADGFFGPEGVEATAIPDKSVTRAAILALPSSQMVMRVLEFPVTDPAELTAMTELQVDKFAPFPLDQMVVSHEVLAQQEGRSIVLAVAARIAVVIEAGQRLTAAHGLRIVRVDALLLGRWQTLREAGQIEDKGRETLVLVDESGVDVLTHEAGVPVGLSGLGDVPVSIDAASADDLAQELMHLLMGIEVERGRQAQSVITVWSDGRDASALIGALQSRASIPVRQRLLGTLPSAVSGVAGRAALDTGSRLLDLTPPAWHQTEAAHDFRRRLILITGILLGGWLLLAAGGWGLMAWQRARVAQLESADQRWSEPAGAVRRLRTQAQLIQRYMDRRTSALECLREVSMLQPPGVDLASFTYRKGDGLKLEGEADSGALVIEYNEKLNASELFETVKAGPRTLTAKGRHRFSFEIIFKKETP